VDFYLYGGLFDGSDVTMKQHDLSPKQHIIGFLLSLLLTFAALGVTLKAPFSESVKITVIFALAFVQFVIQLLFFMHLTEGRVKFFQVINMWFAVFIAVVVVAGSVWIMLYNTMHL
jgi:cytochrome aa3-600 menaquinol oxidase subunit IV